MTNWRMTINTGQYLIKHEDGTATAREVATAIADLLDKETSAIMATEMLGFDAVFDAENIAEDFRSVGGNADPAEDNDELTECMSSLYDWADSNNVWLTPLVQARHDAQQIGGAS